MRKIAHISDLHFGHNDPALFAPLRRRLAALEPHILVVSGDLVEHATQSEFCDARDYLNSLPQPQIVVPGNHDLPFYDPFRRVLQGLSLFRRYITADASPEYLDDEIAVVGADSAHLFPIKGGRITPLQLTSIVSRFRSFPEGLIRVLVTHHPFDLPDPLNPHLLIGHSRRAVLRLMPVVDVLMAGHVHLSAVGSTSTRYKTREGAMAFIQAGTAISSRNKGEANSFNLIRTGRVEAKKQIAVDRYSWSKDSGEFECKNSSEFLLGAEGWAQVPPAAKQPAEPVSPSR